MAGRSSSGDALAKRPPSLQPNRRPQRLAVRPNPGAAQSAEKRAEALLSQMTLAEKIDYLGGLNGSCIRAIERLGIPAIKMSDGPMAARNDGPTTAYPAGIALSATWDRGLARKIGVALGRDCRARGFNLLLGPAVNIYRSPLCGRNFEYLGEDPFLAAELVAPLIQGVQSQEVLAAVKHFACNNQEWDRLRTSSQVDERTLQEIYLPVFKAAVQQGRVGCVIVAYNLVNGVYCSQNDYLINQTLKGDWDFKGFVISDWGAVHDGIAAVNAGLDLEMPNGRFMNRTNLLPALQDGRVKESTIDDKVRRILRTIIAAGFLDRPQVRKDIPLDDPKNGRTALEGARESIVLLKNAQHTLPWDRKMIKSIAVLGPNADPAVYCGGGSAFPQVFHATSLLDGIKQIAGDSIKVLHSANAKRPQRSSSKPMSPLFASDSTSAWRPKAGIAHLNCRRGRRISFVRLRPPIRALSWSSMPVAALRGLAGWKTCPPSCRPGIRGRRADAPSPRFCLAT